jgi:carbonic anhydrase
MSELALQRLLEGNRRFAADQPTLDGSSLRRSEVAQGQVPFAAILGCADSRVPPELIFDQGLGNLFVVRTAGETLDQAALESLEFGVEELHIPLLVVLGHERCGAIKIAIEALDGQVEIDTVYLLEALAPAVEQGKRMSSSPESGEAGLWEQAGRAQVALQVERLRREPILAAAADAGDLKIVGAWYSLDTGLVEITVA